MKWIIWCKSIVLQHHNFICVIWHRKNWKRKNKRKVFSANCDIILVYQEQFSPPSWKYNLLREKDGKMGSKHGKFPFHSCSTPQQPTNDDEFCVKYHNFHHKCFRSCFNFSTYKVSCWLRMFSFVIYCDLCSCYILETPQHQFHDNGSYLLKIGLCNTFRKVLDFHFH